MLQYGNASDYSNMLQYIALLSPLLRCWQMRQRGKPEKEEKLCAARHQGEAGLYRRWRRGESMQRREMSTVDGVDGMEPVQPVVRRRNTD